MLYPLRRALPRATLSSSLYQAQLRRYSSQQPSPTSAFYKTFTRPVAKTALLAVLVYQLVYFGWTKLEYDEIKTERQAEITELEGQVRSLQQQAVAAAAASANSGAPKREGGEKGGKGGKGWWPW